MKEMRSIVEQLVTQLHANVKDWELHFCNRKPTSDFRDLKNLRSIASKE